MDERTPAELGVRTADRGTVTLDGSTPLPVEASYVTVLDPSKRDLAPEYHLVLTFVSDAARVGEVMSAAAGALVEVEGVVFEPMDLRGLGAAWQESDRCLGRVGLALIGAAPGVAPGRTPPSRDKPLPRENPGRWIEPENYPREAVAAKAEGTTRVEVSVDRFGYPTACHIAQTAGSAVLDATTCDRLMKKAHFFPAIGVDGMAVEGVWESAVSWRLGA